MAEPMSTAERKDDSWRATPLPWRSARTLYNLADAGFGTGDFDVAPAVARELRHAGPCAARALWLWLAWLDWEPIASGRARRVFWRLPRGERAAALARWQHSRIPARRRAHARLAAWLDVALAGRQSSDGA